MTLTAKNTQRHSPDTVQVRKNIWLPILKKSEVRYRHPYQARHTFATMLISEGRNLWWVADQMGPKCYLGIMATTSKSMIWN
ncbi:hypothetical protein BIW53_08805 [Pseudoalteromonas byunsanensis]|uniref:Tyr recombinase domain-containing protein n=1 Tax=Pseudoalteromonas byunsanensis TaxID=327939 RepID=A0A1S1N464_9GAMM|nr:hypothetical protein BIW53_08805 [Pseudoalteromonas byunsanensis]